MAVSLSAVTQAPPGRAPAIAESNGRQLFLFGSQNRTFGSCLATTHRILIPAMCRRTGRLREPDNHDDGAAHGQSGAGGGHVVPVSGGSLYRHTALLPRGWRAARRAPWGLGFRV
jgi:hypothetical protein